MNPKAGITRCIQCGSLVLHPGGQKPKPLEVDTHKPHTCSTPLSRDFMRTYGDLGRSRP